MDLLFHPFGYNCYGNLLPFLTICKSTAKMLYGWHNFGWKSAISIQLDTSLVIKSLQYYISNLLQYSIMYVGTYVIYKSIVKIAHFLVIKLAHFEMRKKKYSVYGLDRKMVIKQIVDSCQRLLTILFFRRFWKVGNDSF